MQEINQKLYRNNQLYHDLADHMIENRQKADRLRQQYIAAPGILTCRADAIRRRGSLQAAKSQSISLPPDDAGSSNAVKRTLSGISTGLPPYNRMGNLTFLRRIENISGVYFHSAAVDCAAQLSKEKAPVPSIIFDGLGEEIYLKRQSRQPLCLTPQMDSQRIKCRERTRPLSSRGNG